jgi:hypothetical protein
MPSATRSSHSPGSNLRAAGAAGAAAAAAAGLGSSSSELGVFSRLQQTVAVPGPGSAGLPLLSFLGSSREGVRLESLRVAEEVLGDSFRLLAFEPGSGSKDPLSWVPAFVNSSLVLAPRGVGATSFRLYEALQLCCILCRQPMLAQEGLRTGQRALAQAEL